MMFFRGYNLIEPGCFRFAYGDWRMIVPWIITALVGIAVIILVLSITKHLIFNPHRDVMQKLKIKYVNGEISQEEYLKRKEILNR